MHADPDIILYRESGDVYSIDFSPEGSLLALAHADSTIRVCYPLIAEELWCFDVDFYPTVVRFSPDGILLVAGSLDSSLQVWNVSTGRLQTEIPTDGPNHHIRFNPWSKLLASLEESGTCVFWNLESEESVGTLEFGEDAVSDFSFASDGTLLAACHGSEVQIWDLVRQGLLRSFHGHQAEVRAAAFSPDGRYVASASADGALILWDVHTLATIWTYADSESPIHLVAFDYSGNLIAAAHDDQSIQTYQTSRGNLEMTLVFPGDIYSLAFSREGQCLAVAGEGSVRIWCEGSQKVGTDLDRFRGATAEGWIKPRYATER